MQVSCHFGAACQCRACSSAAAGDRRAPRLGQDVVDVGHQAAAVPQRVALAHHGVHQRAVRLVLSGCAQIGRREHALLADADAVAGQRPRGAAAAATRAQHKFLHRAPVGAVAAGACALAASTALSEW